MAIANTTIQLKKSGISGNVPVYLSSGELALNFYDGRLYYKNAQNTINYFAAGITKSFATVNSNSSLVLASSNNDIISLASGFDVRITTDTVNKIITLSTANVAWNLANAAFTHAEAAFQSANIGGGGSGSASIFQTISSNTVLTPSQFNILANTVNGAINITLPSNIFEGFSLKIGDGGGNKDINPVYINGANNKINGVMDTLLFNSNGVAFTMVYSLGTWRTLINA